MQRRPARPCGVIRAAEPGAVNAEQIDAVLGRQAAAPPANSDVACCVVIFCADSRARQLHGRTAYRCLHPLR